MNNDFINKMEKLTGVVNDMIVESRKAYAMAIKDVPEGKDKEILKAMIKKAESGESKPEELMEMMKNISHANTK